ncbi:interferon-induced protein 44-like [Saccostrea cucullata]|uniref:interferon-induced protein 44-like n=1 Tax=Saccostrea cuccullata TaxID=36930 RepID=UPI002ED578F9
MAEDKGQPMIKENFLRRILEIKPRNDTTLNILLLGQTGCGKSSFVNACLTALLQEGRVIKQAPVGPMTAESLTRRFISYKLKIKTNGQDAELPIQLFDSPGLQSEENKGVHTDDIKMMCRGFIKSNYLINSTNPIQSNNEMYREDPEEKDKVHCIVHVFAADVKEFVHKKVEGQLKKIKNEFREDIPQVILLTKVDRLGIADITQMFRHKMVKEYCMKAAAILDLCENDVLPQVSYSDEMVPSVYKDLVTLFNIKTIMERANDRVNGQIIPNDNSAND